MSNEEHDRDPKNHEMRNARLTTNSTSGNISFSGSYLCSRCNQWVGNYQVHNCSTYFPFNYDYNHAQSCKYCCGTDHNTAEKCPRVKSIKYYDDGSICKIAFHKEKLV